ncbi:MAG: DUF3617 domain-containing protein [Allosphingosinicella sp.]|uniref:DUF3617 domain-containing protein n=1 Tax=Allosphingosinicella sp. TaxID=2823234 RepID=UPI0039526D86
MRWAPLGLLALSACQPAQTPPAAAVMTEEEVAEELAAIRIEPGLWERSIEVLSAEGGSAGTAEELRGQRTVQRDCTTPEQARRPDTNFLAAQQQGACSYRDFLLENGRLRATSVCTTAEEGEVGIVTEGSYGPRAYDLTSQFEGSAGPGQPARVRIRTAGRHVGPCP